MKKQALKFFTFIMCFALMFAVMIPSVFAEDGETVNYNLWVGAPE